MSDLLEEAKKLRKELELHIGPKWIDILDDLIAEVERLIRDNDSKDRAFRNYLEKCEDLTKERDELKSSLIYWRENPHTLHLEEFKKLNAENKDMKEDFKYQMDKLTAENLQQSKDWDELDDELQKIKAQNVELKRDLKLQEQDNERIIQSSKGVLDRMKAENAELTNKCLEWLAGSVANQDEITALTAKLTTSEKARLDAEEKLALVIPSDWKRK